VSAQEIIEAMKAAQNTAEELRQLKLTVPAPIVVFDNLNVYAGVKYQQLHNQPRMLNYTVVYLACNPETQLRRCLIRSDVDLSKIQQITSVDIIPTPQMKMDSGRPC
jgi:tRNA uridine 5-carbamoylmethylation protein Kti12